LLMPKTLYMKTIFTSIALALTTVGAHAQDSLEFNNVRALIHPNGVFFHDPSSEIENAHPGYEVPKGSGAHAIFAMNLLMAGKDGNDLLRSASAHYNVSDFYPGPITQNAGQYNTPAYQSRYDRLWTVLKSDIDNHIANWNTIGYVAPASLLSWPGNGDVSNGEPAIIAPFQDNNGNGIYEPANGDYPVIRGDQATLSILNDVAGIHPSSGGEPLKVELHLLFYQYADAGDLGHTTFLHAEVINRSTQQLTDFHFGAFIDFDLGGSFDDYIGTSVAHNLAYVYNGDLNDQSSGDITGYGTFPPSVGVMTLNKPLYSHVSREGVNSQSFPAEGAVQEYNVLNGLYKFGDPQLDNNQETTRYSYYGPGTTGWTAAESLTAPGEQKSYISFAPAIFSPNQSFCYDLGIIYARKEGEDLFASVDSLLLVAEKIQQFYNDEAYGCADGFLAVETLGANSQLNIYPNPAGDHLTIGGMQTGDYEITAPDGRRVLAGKFSHAEIDLQHLAAGYYVLTIYHAGAAHSVKLLKE